MALQPAEANSELPPELTAAVEAELASGEKLLWVGQPLPGRYARSGIFLLIFGIFWCVILTGIASVVLGMGLLAGAGPFGGCFGLFLVPFFLAGIGLLTAPIWMRFQARNTCYAITNERAIIFEPSWIGSRQVHSFRAPGLGNMTRVESSDGVGHLIFQELTSYDAQGHRRSTVRGFKCIANVREVEDLIRRTLLNPTNPESRGTSV